MPGKVVNLRTARKQKARADKRAAGDAAAAKHGQTKAVRDLTEARARLDADRLDGHRLDRREDDDG